MPGEEGGGGAAAAGGGRRRTSVAIERVPSLISPSMSMLHGVTASGCAIATLLSVRTAEKRRHGFGEHRKSWSTVTAGESSRRVTFESEQIALAAS